MGCFLVYVTSDAIPFLQKAENVTTYLAGQEPNATFSLPNIKPNLYGTEGLVLSAASFQIMSSLRLFFPGIEVSFVCLSRKIHTEIQDELQFF